MTLRETFRPLRPDLDNFLFAAVGAEQDGIPLSMLSALTRLGLDPWDEAGRLSSLSKREATEQLARLIADLPDTSRSMADAREIAGGLVVQLPKHDSARPLLPVQARRRFRWPTLPKQSQFLVFCFVAAAAALVSIALHGGLQGIGFP
jgi:hypothetical protein